MNVLLKPKIFFSLLVFKLFANLIEFLILKGISGKYKTVQSKTRSKVAKVSMELKMLRLSKYLVTLTKTISLSCKIGRHFLVESLFCKRMAFR